MTPETRQLRGFVEEAAYVYGLARTRENEAKLLQAWADFLEAFRSDILREVKEPNQGVRR